jgi:hypothetical protein
LFDHNHRFSRMTVCSDRDETRNGRSPCAVQKKAPATRTTLRRGLGLHPVAGTTPAGIATLIDEIGVMLPAAKAKQNKIKALVALSVQSKASTR